MAKTYKIVEKFEITGRGAVVVIDEVTDRVPGRAYNVEITGIHGDALSTEAFKDWLLRRDPTPIEKEAYTLKGLHKEDISDDASISFV